MLRCALSSLQSIEAIDDLGLCVWDVEDRLLRETIKSMDWDSVIRNRSASDGAINVLQVLDTLPKTDFYRLWRKALSDTFDDIEREGKDCVIMFHPSFYSMRRSETYSMVTDVALELERRKSLRIERIIALMDDVYDMWWRLASDGSSHFNHAKWRSERMEAQELDEPTVDKMTFSLITIEGSIDILTSLMRWRRIDLLEAESLALAIRSPITCLGVKRPYSELKALLLQRPGENEPSVVTTYLSHPISRPRRDSRVRIENGQGDAWDEFVGACNALGNRLAAEGIVAVCPTAIDEMRFQPWKEGTDLFKREFALDGRWPLFADPIVEHPDSNGKELLHVGSNGEDRGMGEADIRQVVGDAGGVLARVLENQIYMDVPFRDHYLVVNTDNFFVFRPFYKEGKMSHGVRAEIDHWQDMQLGASQIDIAEGEGSQKRNPRALFVHSLSDLNAVFELLASSEPAKRRFDDSFFRLLDSYYEKVLAFCQSSSREKAIACQGRSHQLDAAKLRVSPVSQKAAIKESFARLVFCELSGLNDSFFLPREGEKCCADVRIGIISGGSPSEDEMASFSDYLKGNGCRVLEGSVFDFSSKAQMAFEEAFKIPIGDWADGVIASHTFGC